MSEILGEVEAEVPQTLRPPEKLARPGPTGKNRSKNDLVFSGEDSSETDPAPRPRGRPRSQPAASTALPVDEFLRASVQEKLKMLLLMGAMPVGMVLPVTGFTLVERADSLSLAVVSVLNQKQLLRLQKFLDGTKWAAVAQNGAAIVTAIAVDVHMVSPTSMPAQMMIKDVLDKYFKDDTAKEAPIPSDPNGHEPDYAGSIISEHDSVASPA